MYLKGVFKKSASFLLAGIIPVSGPPSCSLCPALSVTFYLPPVSRPSWCMGPDMRQKLVLVLYLRLFLIVLN